MHISILFIYLLFIIYTRLSFAIIYLFIYHLSFIYYIHTYQGWTNLPEAIPTRTQ